MNSRKDFSDADWEKAETDLKKASKLSGMFFALEDDGDAAQVAFMQTPIYRTLQPFKTGGNVRTVGTCNVALFIDGEYKKLMLADFARKHWKPFLRRIRKNGMKSLYTITRDGIAGDTQTTYDCEFDRKLTDEENVLLDELEFLSIKEDGSDSETNWLDQFRKTCATEWERLGWDKEQGKASIVTLFGTFIAAADQDITQRIDYISALKQLKKGDGPEQCTGLDATIDLDADVEF